MADFEERPSVVSVNLAATDLENPRLPETVAGPLQPPDSHRSGSSVILMAHAFSLDVVAEGVETTRWLDLGVPGSDGMSGLRTIHAERPETPVSS